MSINFSFSAKPPRMLLWALVSLLCIATSTWVGYHFRLNLATMGFLYLIFVIAAAIRTGFWFATANSVVSVLCLNYFFVPPLFSLSVMDPANWIALGAFELSALVISRLSQTADERAKEAIRERRDAERLYKVALQIVLLHRSQNPGDFLASIILESFELRNVVLFDAIAGSTYAGTGTKKHVSNSADISFLEEGVRRAFLKDSNEFNAAREIWFCVLRSNLRPVGALALSGPGMGSLIATTLASLCEISLDRYRSVERECRAEAVRQAEQLRAAVLDSLAHQIKTPVSTIWAASSGLLTLGGLSETQQLLMGLLDEQSKKLSDIASQLLTIARLDTPAMAPKRELLCLADVVDETVQTLGAGQSRGRLRISCTNEEVPVLGDRKLISNALGQIIGNAFKYSTEATPIIVSVGMGPTGGKVSVQNHGPTIQPSDRDRIFDRFYRHDTIRQKSSGSGLGLSIVKRVVEAHEGKVWVESDGGTTTFSFVLPLAPREVIAAANLPD